MSASQKMSLTLIAIALHPRLLSGGSVIATSKVIEDTQVAGLLWG